jgi:hypothetical protein
VLPVTCAIDAVAEDVMSVMLSVDGVQPRVTSPLASTPRNENAGAWRVTSSAAERHLNDACLEARCQRSRRLGTWYQRSPTAVRAMTCVGSAHGGDRKVMDDVAGDPNVTTDGVQVRVTCRCFDQSSTRSRVCVSAVGASAAGGLWISRRGRLEVLAASGVEGSNW